MSDETNKVSKQPEPEAGAAIPAAPVADVSSVPPEPAAEAEQQAAPQESDADELANKPAGDEAVAATAAEEEGGGEEEGSQRDWYILKVQSNRETTISDALRRRIKIEGLEDFFGEVIVPTEMVTEFKGGKKRVVKRKLYPGYIVVNMEVTDDTWFLVRDTPGIGDFTGSGGKPIPMQPHEVDRIIQREEEDSEEAPKLKIAFKSGDHVKVKEGNFESFEGEVDTIDETNGRVTVMINIFGRSTPVELEYWQIENV